MLEQYTPKDFCKEFAELHIAQLPLIMATVKGLKPLTDIWVEKRNYAEFGKACKKYGLLYQPSVVFNKPTREQLSNAIDNYTLTTTKTIGTPFNPKSEGGNVQVFISKSKNAIFNAHRFGWYPIITRGRVINKPFMDHLRFGEVLGYPDCCIDFFKNYNKAGVSTPYETYKNTQGKFSYYCNNILNSNSYSYIHHYTCSFNCKKTIKFAKEIEKEIQKEEPEFVNQIQTETTRPLLIFGERHAYIFNGPIKNNLIRYNQARFVGMPEHNIHEEKFQHGNMVKVEKDFITIYKDDAVINTIQKHENEFLLVFEK